MNEELKDEGTRNFVKTILALRCVKSGILPFLKQKCAELHTQYLNDLETICGRSGYTCTRCHIKTLEPYHSSKIPCKYAKAKLKCDCRRQGKISCSEGTCGIIYDLIKDDHVQNDPNWSNTNSEMWSDKQRGPWEIMKSFISTRGYESKTNISDADITALIQICINNSRLRCELGDNLKYLEKIKDIRNLVFHSGTLKISSADVHMYLSKMEDALNLHIFCFPEVKDELKNLENIKQDISRLTIEDEVTARTETLVAIRELQILTEQQDNIQDLKCDIAQLQRVQLEHTRALDDRLNAIEKHMLKLQEEHMKNKTFLNHQRSVIYDLDTMNRKMDQISHASVMLRYVSINCEL
ncbi:uncharacterized protein LOC127849657 [Dreissena polymorpha]|uniref:uncharacterized protein LOC127849657 n=1 Tax=Dreissena polymorpha TaxID=45954 RepID=UPI00226549E7|nr:uncharacterized protein LOC127849657 [Dreissena polymorpha]